MHGISPRLLPKCPCCSHPLREWRRGASIDSCRVCKRPLVLAPSLLNPRGPHTLRSLLDLAGGLYGTATLVLVVVFLLSGMPALYFVKYFSVLLYVIGSALLVDGFLGLRSKIDRTWGKLRYANHAILMAIGKLNAGAMAIVLTIVGIMM